MAKTYRILLDSEHIGKASYIVPITEEGALILWSVYEKLNPHANQSMERREERGGICWLSEINWWKKQGALPQDFNWEDYKVE